MENSLQLVTWEISFGHLTGDMKAGEIKQVQLVYKR